LLIFNKDSVVTKISHTSYPFNWSHIWKFLLHYLQNFAGFSHDNLTVSTLSKYSRQRKHRS